NAGRIEVVELRSGKRTVVHQGGTYARYAGSGHLLYLNNRTLFAAPFDLGSLKMTALPAPVLQDISSSPEGGAQYDVSAGGTIVYLTGQSAGARNALVWSDRQGKLTPVVESRREYLSPPRLSPDGRRVAVPIVADGNTDIWIIDLVRDTQTRLTFDEGRDLYPVWSHDGQFVYFTSNRLGKWNILRKRADGTGPEESMITSDEEMDAYAASADGQYLGFHNLSSSGDTMILPLKGEPKPRPIFTSPASDGDPVFSPDGRWVSYDSDESGRWEVYVRPIDGKGGRWQVSAQGGEFARWSKDGTALYYLERNKAAWKVPVRAVGSTFEVGRPEKLFDLSPGLQSDWDVTADGNRYLLIQSETSSAANGHNMVKITFNWFGELRALLATRP
ncbi:MAG TPA: hypothetical protein VMQ62_04850, partial [Dongiaceae bacterium]|nr:hypothetical protein [Dongiaceae bacterium]